jgi:2-methylcitrate dehydratase PrpD
MPRLQSARNMGCVLQILSPPPWASNIVEAQFSGPFVIASALATGKMVWDSYRGLNNPEIRRLMQRIVCENDPEIEAQFTANILAS